MLDLPMNIDGRAMHAVFVLYELRYLQGAVLSSCPFWLDPADRNFRYLGLGGQQDR